MIEDVGYLPSRCSRRRSPASSRTASSTRSCASASRSSTRASSTARSSTSNVKWGIGYKLAVIPPMQLLDMAGLDIYSAVASYLNQDLSNEHGHLVDHPGPGRRRAASA